jgi:hypothetical protein
MSSSVGCMSNTTFYLQREEDVRCLGIGLKEGKETTRTEVMRCQGKGNYGVLSINFLSPLTYQAREYSPCSLSSYTTISSDCMLFVLFNHLLATIPVYFGVTDDGVIAAVCSPEFLSLRYNAIRSCCTAIKACTFGCGKEEYSYSTLRYCLVLAIY